MTNKRGRLQLGIIWGLVAGLAVLQRYDARAGWQATEVVDQLASGVSGLCFAGDRLLAAWQNRQGVVAAFP